MKRTGLSKAHPATFVLGSFLLLILAGALLLMLPGCTHAGALSWIDALFTSASAVCVTGLVVVDTGTTFSFPGQLVILGLIQLGGLGVMTISVILFQWVGGIVSLRHRMLMQDLYAHSPRKDILGLVRSVVVFTLGAELVGAALLAAHWYGEFSLSEAVYLGCFHAVSAFCNAGFALFPDSMVRYGGSVLLNVTIMVLIIVGGLGFPVLYELRNKLGEWRRNRRVLARGGPAGRRIRLSVQTRTVLVTTLGLIVAGALLLALLECRDAGTGGSLAHGILAPLFQSVTCRTAGFNTVDVGSLNDAAILVMIFLMFVGASPGSCGGGVKTTTFALIVAYAASRVGKRRRVNMFGRTIPETTVSRSITLAFVSMVFIAVVLFLLLAGESVGQPVMHAHRSFLAHLFETVSAFCTVGLSMGLTPQLTLWGKAWIILTMIVGRVGLLTFAYVIIGSGASGGAELAEENIMIG